MRLSQSKKSKRVNPGSVFTLPAVLLLVLVLYAPVAVGFYESLHNIRGAVPDEFVGLRNYQLVFTDPTLPQMIWRTILFVIAATAFTVIVAMLIAIAVDDLPNRLANIAQIGIIIPWAISSIVGAALFRWFYVSDLGFFRYALSLMSLEFEPLMNPSTAMAALVGSAVWKKAGFAVVLLLSGLKAIPLELYEAARVDGATRIQSFTRITLPLVKGQIAIVAIVLAISNFNEVELPLVVTGGGPLDT
ncbi:MAG: sugar ABC transporter permease, partial [Pseudomonadota bacterium]